MIIINLADGQHVPEKSPLFIRFRKPNIGKDLCRAVCKDAPHYQCTRSEGHYRRVDSRCKSGHTLSDSQDRDHAAHGVNGEMFARWNDDNGGESSK